MEIGKSVDNMVYYSVTNEINLKLYEIVKDSASLDLRYTTSRHMSIFRLRPYLILIYLYK